MSYLSKTLAERDIETAIRSQAGHYLSTIRIRHVLRAICSANGLSDRRSLSRRVSEEDNAAVVGEPMARLITLSNSDMLRAEGIDSTLTEILGEERTITGGYAYKQGVLRFEEPSDYIDRDHIARWITSLEKAGVHDDGSIEGCDTKPGKVEQKLQGMTWKAYLNQ